MSKELPYFRFYPSEWLEGDITLENERTQGFFITLLSWYWKKDCIIDLEFINKRLVNGKATLKQCLNNLIESNIIKVDDNQTVTINFLDNQYDLLSEKRQKLVEAGRAGGKASLKYRLSYKDKDNNKDKINIRREKFIQSVIAFNSYPKEMLEKFINHWTELNKSKTKMKFELQQTFEISKRLVTWKNNEIKFQNNSPKKEYHATDF